MIGNELDAPHIDETNDVSSMRKTIELLKTQKQDLEIALLTTAEHGDTVEEQLREVNQQLETEIHERVKVEQALEKLVKTIQQQKNDLEMALHNAIEHGDAIQDELFEVNRQLNSEIGEREQIELKLKSMVENLNRQKDDLEVLVDTIASHGDEINSQMEAKLNNFEELAMTDPLTALDNRRSYNQALEKEWSRSSRSQTSLALLVVDIDNFKAYNDAYGHHQGDRCLKQVAQVLSNNSRRNDDHVARYGGEEFVLLLPATSHEDALIIARKIVADVAGLQIQHTISPHAVVTVSIGVAALIPAHDIKPGILFDQADAHLYRAKNSGRNCVNGGA